MKKGQLTVSRLSMYILPKICMYQMYAVVFDRYIIDLIYVNILNKKRVDYIINRFMKVVDILLNFWERKNIDFHVIQVLNSRKIRN
jgi:hypothetical protein